MSRYTLPMLLIDTKANYRRGLIQRTTRYTVLVERHPTFIWILIKTIERCYYAHNSGAVLSFNGDQVGHLRDLSGWESLVELDARHEKIDQWASAGIRAS